MDKINKLLFIYFIQAFKKEKQITIKYNNSPLEFFKIKEIEDNDKIEYDVVLYRLDISLFFNKKEIKYINLLLEDKEEGIFEALIEINDKLLQNLFIFNLKFKRKKFLILETYPLGQYNLTNLEQYEIFKSFINLKEIPYLVDSAKNVILNSGKYTFPFFVNIFCDIDLIDNMLEFCRIFDIQKITSLGKIDKDKLIIAKNKVNTHFDKIEQYIIIKEREIIENVLQKIAIFLFYFNYYYQRENVINILDNKVYNIYIYEKLIKKEKEFDNFNLSKIWINKLLKFIKNFNELSIIISYNDNILETLEIINQNKILFFKLFCKIKENEENNNIIILKRKNIKINDNMKKIKIEMEKLLYFEKEKNHFFVDFEDKFFEKYINLFNLRKINDLINIKEIIKIIIIYDKRKDFKNELKLLHQNLLKYANGGNMEIFNLLWFIKNDEFLFNNDLENQAILSINIFNSMKINNKINDEFIKKWKEIKWLQLFKNSEQLFYEKICSLLAHVKYFGKLFFLFDLYNKEKDYTNLCLSIMKDRFIELLNNYSKDECPNFIDDSSNLIYYLNAKNISIKSLINDFLSKKLEKKYIHEIYYKIYSNDKFTIFNDELKNIIFEFYKNNDCQKYKNAFYLGFCIQNNEIINKEDLSDLNNYIIQHNDFYNIEESDKFRLLRKIIESKSIENKTIIKIINYIQSTKTVIAIIIKDIINGNIKFSLINQFYSNKKEKVLLERIKLISLWVDDENIKNKFSIWKETYKEKMDYLYKIIKNLKIVQQKLKVYYPNSKKEDIIKINEILENINNNDLFYYRKYEGEIYSYLNQEDLKTLNLDINKENIFFKKLYEEKKKLYKDNDILIMQETKKELNIIIKIIKENSIKNTNINNLCLLLNKLTKEEIKNISKEIDKIIVQYKINIINKEKLIHELILVYKKNLIYESIEKFLSFIDITKVQQEEFTHINKVIIKYLKNPSDVKTIEFCLELLKNYGIEFKEESNYRILEIIDIIKNKNNIIEFLLNISLEKCKDLLKYIFDYFQKKNLNKENIPNLVECKNFINKIINKNIKDKDIIKSLFNAISEFKNIEMNLRKLMKNFDLISYIIKNRT